MFSNNISFSDISPATEEEIPLTPGADKSVWSDVVNLRLRQDGHITSLKPRGASTSLPVTGAGVHQGIVFQHPFSARLLFGMRDFIATQYTDGVVELWCVDDGYTITLSGEVFSTTEPVNICIIGFFLYIFDDNTDKARYVDLSKLKADKSVTTLTPSKWLAHMPSAPSTGAAGKLTIEDDKDNVFGLTVGSKVIAFPNFSESNGVGREVSVKTVYLGGRPESNPYYDGVTDGLYIDYSKLEVDGYQLLEGKVYEYEYIGGTAIRVDDVLYSELGARVVFAPEQDTTAYIVYENPTTDGPAQIDHTLLEYDNWGDRPTDTITPFETHIARINPIAGEYEVFITDSNGREWGTAGPDAVYKILRATTDTDNLIDKGAKYYKTSDGAIKKDTNYSYPSLYRGYRVVDVLDDGSVTSPSQIMVFSKRLDELVTAMGTIADIELSLPPAASNIVSRQLYSTRWLTDKKEVYNPSSKRYPNSPFFFHSEIGTDEYQSFQDNKFDSELTQPLSGAVPMTGGVSKLIAPTGGESGIIPSTATSYRGSMIFGGLLYRRPVAQLNNNISISATGTPVTQNGSLKIYFKYTNGDHSPPVEYNVTDGLTYSISASAPNAIVSSINVYYVDSLAATYLVAEHNQQSPEFHGFEFEFSTGDIADLNTANLPTRIATELYLGNYITSAAPPQMVTLDRSTRIADNANVESIITERFDDDKATMRYMLLIFTDQNIQRGYLTDATQDGLVIYDGDFEVISEDQKAISPEIFGSKGSVIFFEGINGINAISGGKIAELINKREVIDSSGNQIIDGNVSSIAYNEEYDELLIATTRQEIIVYSFDSKLTTIFKYNSTIESAVNIDKDIYAVSTDGGTVTHLLLEDYSDNVTNIGCSITSMPIGSPLENTRILEATLYGEGFSTNLKIDLQAGRKEGQTGWSKVFNEADVNLPERDLQMYGVSYGVGYAGHMPRIKLDMTGTTEAFLSDVILKTVQTPNTGKARK